MSTTQRTGTEGWLVREVAVEGRTYRVSMNPASQPILVVQLLGMESDFAREAAEQSHQEVMSGRSLEDFNDGATWLVVEDVTP